MRPAYGPRPETKEVYNWERELYEEFGLNFTSIFYDEMYRTIINEPLQELDSQLDRELINLLING